MKAEVHRAPVPTLPALHQIVLPTPWDIGPVQIYLVEGDPLTLIDTGVRNEPSRGALCAALDALGYAPEDLGRVILTHYHTDHMGQVQTLRDLGADLEVWVHEDDAASVESYSVESEERVEPTNELFREHGVPEALLARQTAHIRGWIEREPVLAEATRVDRRLRDGERVPFKEFEFEVIHAAGHTAGHVVLAESETGTLVTGDHLMGDAVPFTEYYYTEGVPDPADPLRRRPRFRGLPAYLRSLRQLRAAEFRIILPAHGGIVRRPARAIDDALLFYDVRLQRVRRALSDAGAATAWQLWERLFPKADPVAQMRTRMMMVIGALDVCEDTGTAQPERRDDGALLYRAA